MRRDTIWQSVEVTAGGKSGWTLVNVAGGAPSVIEWPDVLAPGTPITIAGSQFFAGACASAGRRVHVELLLEPPPKPKREVLEDLPRLSRKGK